VRSTFPVLDRAAPLPGCLPEDEVCSSPTACAEPTARPSADDAHPASVGPAWDVDAPLSEATPSLPVALVDPEACAPAAQQAQRAPSPPRKQERPRPARSFVDVLACLM
jgi:hypothetical protein